MLFPILLAVLARQVHMLAAENAQMRPGIWPSRRWRIPACLLSMQRLLKDCEEKAEAAKRPSQQQPAPAPGAPSGLQRRAPGGQTTSSGSEEDEGDSDGSASGGAAPAPAAPGAASSAEEHSSGEDGSGEGGFVPNLERLKKLGKRAGPGERAAAAACCWMRLRAGELTTPQSCCRGWLYRPAQPACHGLSAVILSPPHVCAQAAR